MAEEENAAALKAEELKRMAEEESEQAVRKFKRIKKAILAFNIVLFLVILLLILALVLKY